MRFIIPVLFITIVVSVTLCDAQNSGRPNDSRPTPAEIDQWISEDMERQLNATRESLAANSRRSVIENFMSDGTWVVVLISEGGMLGSITLFGINSDGKLLCGSNSSATSIAQEANTDLLELAAEIATDHAVKSSAKSDKVSKGLQRYCRDCSQESFIVHSRNGDKWRTIRYPITKTDGPLMKLYQAIPPNGGCENR